MGRGGYKIAVLMIDFLLKRTKGNAMKVTRKRCQNSKLPQYFQRSKKGKGQENEKTAKTVKTTKRQGKSN